MLIELNGIEKTFKTRRDGVPLKVLKGINLTIEKGEMVAIKGSSGAGKSTLLHILGCLDRPTKGIYQLDGMDMTKASSTELSKIRNKKFGFVMQHFALVEEDISQARGKNRRETHITHHTILPSEIVIIRLQMLATNSSCVTIMMVMP